MLRTTKNMKDRYEKIQTILFSLIPEKWESIYLYASVITGAVNSQTGELFFYYLPKGILKKRPINVYEVPQRFNINEEQYLQVVRNLYDSIKDLKQDFINTDQDLWTNLTISINNVRFKVEYNYDPLPRDEIGNEEKRVIWRYKYLGIGGEKKQEKKILDEYFANKIPKVRKNEIYEAGIYIKTENVGVRFDKEDSSNSPREVVEYEREEEHEEKIERQERDKRNKKEIDLEDERPSKNQILNI